MVLQDAEMAEIVSWNSRLQQQTASETMTELEVLQ
jgi:hypothetical protein